MASLLKSYQELQQDPDEQWRDDEPTPALSPIIQRRSIRHHPLLPWIITATTLVFLAVSVTANIFLTWQTKGVTPPEPQETESVSYYGPSHHFASIPTKSRCD